MMTGSSRTLLIRGMLDVCHKNDDDDNSGLARRSKGVSVRRIPPQHRLFVVMFDAQIESIPLARRIGSVPCEKMEVLFGLFTRQRSVESVTGNVIYKVFVFMSTPFYDMFVSYYTSLSLLAPAKCEETE